MKIRFNKRAAEPITVVFIVVAIIAGLFFIQREGFFAIFIPQVGQPSGGGDSLVNQLYYDSAVSDPNFACETENLVAFRTTFPHSQTTLPGTGDEIAIYTGSGNTLARFKFTSTIAYGNGPCTYQAQVLHILSGGLKVVLKSGNYMICKDGLTSGANAKKFATTGATISDSIVSQGGNELILGEQPIIGQPRYACVGGDVYSVYCSDFSSQNTREYGCPLEQPCTFFSGLSINNGVYDAVKCGSSAQVFKPNQNLCIPVGGNKLYSTNEAGTQLTNIICPVTCTNGQCINCINGNTRCSSPSSSTDIDICVGGVWQPKTTTDATCFGDQTCHQTGSIALGTSSAVCSNQFSPNDEQCLGLQPQKRNPTNTGWVNNGDSCDIGCSVENGIATCQLQCTPTGYSCAGGYLTQCLSTDRDNELNYTGGCLIQTAQDKCFDTTKCKPAYEINQKYCSLGNVVRGVSTGNSFDVYGGVQTLLEQTCSNGCEIINGIAQCKPAPGCANHSGDSICSDQVTKKVCSVDGQSYVGTAQDCSIGGGHCEVQNGQGVCVAPASQCTGNSFCSGGNSGGNILACSNGQPGNVINSCNNLGCYTDANTVPRCNNQCQTLGAYQCQSGDSYQCVRNQTTNQNILALVNQCGSGCDSVSGQCTFVGSPGDYICAGINNNQIYQIGQNQQLNLIATCGSGGNYCSPGIGYCRYCERGSLFCSNNQQLICENEQTGATNLFNDCPAGCFTGNQNSYCDQVSFSVTSSQNFFANQPIIISLNLKGSQSNNGLQTTGTATIVGQGVSQTETATSGSNGIMNFGFGIQPIGTYTITINLPEYEKTEIITVRVSNDYQVRIFGPSTILKIPGVVTKVQIEAKDMNNNAPSSMSIAETPVGVSADVVPTAIAGRYDLIINAEPGIYKIKLRPENLEPQEVTAEIREPSLQISSAIPSTEKIGEHQYDVKIKGPTSSSGTIGDITPSSKSAKVYFGGQTTNVDLLELGTGAYIFKYNFASEGTYTINFEAAKEGYEDEVQSYTIQISSSGNVQAPGTSAQGNQTAVGTGVISSLQDKLPWWLWLIVIGGIIYYFSRRK